MTSDITLQLRRSLIKFIKNVCRAYVLIDGVVKVVNSNYTVDITVQGVTYSNVPVKVLIGSQASIYEVPVVGSNCLVKWRDGNRGLPQIVSFDKVDKYYISPISNLFISCEQIQFNDGLNGGIPLTPNVVTQLNTIIQNQNSILSVLKAVTIPSTPFNFAPLFSGISPLSNVQNSQIENTKITQ